MKTDKNYLEICKTIASDYKEEQARQQATALEALKTIVATEKHIDLVEFEKDAVGQKFPVDYEGSIPCNGAKFWEQPEVCNIVTLYQDNGLAYGRIYDHEEEHCYDYTLDELDFDAVVALETTASALLK